MKKALLIIVLLLIGFVAFEYVTLPDVSVLANEHPASTAFMDLRREELREAGKNATISYTWVPYSAISPYLRRSVLVSEDNSFYDHEGVDVEGMKKAFDRNLERREFAFGGSTITQQLAKNLYLSPSKNPFRKAKEYVIARRLEKELSKKRILELYLNVVEFGETAYGAEAGARHHFGKSARALTASEAALLAGALPNPRIMNASAPNKRLKARQKTILSRMKRWGHMAETQALREGSPDQKPEEPRPAPEPAVDTTADAAAEVEESQVVEDAPVGDSVEPAAPSTDTAAVQEAEDDPPTDTSPP